MKILIYLLCLQLISLPLQAQNVLTRNAFIGFYSKTPLEDIKAEHRQVYAVINPSDKTIAFSLLLKGFLFEKQLMQTHFNENYVESDRYPKATFTGTFSGDLDATKNGNYPVSVKGKLSLHGVTRTIEVPATLQVKNGEIKGYSSFTILPEDFNIKIPAVVRDKINKKIRVEVKTKWQNK